MQKHLLSYWPSSCFSAARSWFWPTTYSLLPKPSKSALPPRTFRKITIVFRKLRQHEAGRIQFSAPRRKSTEKAPYGMLIKTQEGDAVKSMFNGTVRLSRHVQGYGRTIVIRHRNGLETVYYDLRGATVKVGQNVKAGQTIGIVGESGECCVEMMVNGCVINIETILSLHTQIA